MQIWNHNKDFFLDNLKLDDLDLHLSSKKKKNTKSSLWRLGICMEVHVSYLWFVSCRNFGSLRIIKSDEIKTMRAGRVPPHDGITMVEAIYLKEFQHGRWWWSSYIYWMVSRSSKQWRIRFSDIRYQENQFFRHRCCPMLRDKDTFALFSGKYSISNQWILQTEKCISATRYRILF